MSLRGQARGQPSPALTPTPQPGPGHHEKAPTHLPSEATERGDRRPPITCGERVAGDRLHASPGGRGLACRGAGEPEQQASAPPVRLARDWSSVATNRRLIVGARVRHQLQYPRLIGDELLGVDLAGDVADPPQRRRPGFGYSHCWSSTHRGDPSRCTSASVQDAGARYRHPVPRLARRDGVDCRRGRWTT